VVNEVDVLHERALLEAKCVASIEIMFAKNADFAVDQLQVVDPVGAAASVEDDAADFVAALLVDGRELVPEFSVFVFVLILHLVGVEEFRGSPVFIRPAVIIRLPNGPVDVHAFTSSARPHYLFAVDVLVHLG
jgi:hypothetical protein